MYFYTSLRFTIVALVTSWGWGSDFHTGSGPTILNNKLIIIVVNNTTDDDNDNDNDNNNDTYYNDNNNNDNNDNDNDNDKHDNTNIGQDHKPLFSTSEFWPGLNWPGLIEKA